VAVICAELATVMLPAVTPEPLTATVAPESKPEPFSVTINAEPAFPLVGQIELNSGPAGASEYTSTSESPVLAPVVVVTLN
jgi:hypothetical protein